MAEQGTLKRGVISTFFPTPRFLTMPSVGVDISDKSVKFTGITVQGDKRTLSHFGERPIPDGVMAKGMIQDLPALADIMTALRTEEGIDVIRASLPEEHAYIFRTPVPGDTPHDQIRTILEFKLEEHVPIPLPDAVFDYEVTGEDSGMRQATVSVFSKGIVGAYLDVFKKAGMQTLSLEVEASAMARAVIPEGDLGTYMIVDFGQLRTGICIVSRESVLFTTTVAIGGLPLTQAIQKYLNPPLEEIDRIKNERGILRQDDNRDLYMALLGSVAVLRDEINKHLLYWHTHPSDAGSTAPAPIEKVILCGGGANLAGLPEYLSATLRVPIEIGNVWRNTFSFNDVIPNIDRAHSLGFATAIGLALRTT
jgi:type IV pilus assembly protein PilM